MGEPREGASLGPARAPLDPRADLVETEESDPVAEVTASSSLESKEEKVEQGNTRKKIRRSTNADMTKYQRCSRPGVVGLKADKAKRIIRKGKPDLFCSVVLENQFLTMAYCTNRVRLIVDRSNRVV
ncbi:uncharacterized protein LOC119312853 [Triticum dicoccoides]|uniref:uncharacterized protein LOC119312853 n=1 Tax=Triticum dicoccoides TaxID=85692 RepID=UPI00188E5896|nr:uncharacterized protein LOC119312853 [Triticum dicoccoides]